MIIESHAHLDDEAFDGDRKQLMAQIKRSNIKYVMNVSASLSSIKTSVALANQYDFVYTSVGVHPSETGELNERNFMWMKNQVLVKK